MDGQKMSHLSHFFPEAEEHAVPVRGHPSAHFCLCFVWSWHKQHKEVCFYFYMITKGIEVQAPAQ